MIRKCLWMSGCALVGMSLQAGVWVWTGAGGDAYWTNAANWKVGNTVATVPPGRWLTDGNATQSSGSVTNGVKGDVAIFGDDLAAGGATNIDFSGVFSISNIITTGTKYRYIYGTSATQYVPLEPWGRLTVAELENTPVARVPARLRTGVGIKNGLYNESTGKWTSWYGQETIKFRNNSLTEEFVFENNWGYHIKDPIFSPSGGQTGIQVEGTGSFRIACNYEGSAPFFYDCLTTGKLTIDIKLATRQFNVSAPGEGYPSDTTTQRRIEITANGALASSEGNQVMINAYRPLRIYGDGYLAFTAGMTGGNWASGGISVGANTVIACDTKFRTSTSKTADNWALLAAWPYRIAVCGSAGYALWLTGNTTIGREVVLQNWTIVEDPAVAAGLELAICQVTYDNRHIYRADTFSDTTKGFGPGTFELAAGSSIQYEGAAAETMTRGIVITNLKSGTVEGRLTQAGAGKWTVASAVTTAGGRSASTLYLSGVTAANIAAAEFTGTLDDKVTVAHESGDWTFAPADGKCAKLAPAGGQMRLKADTTLTVGEIAPTANGSVIVVPANCTLNVGKLVTAAAKTMDFVLTADTSSVTIDPAADNVLTGLKMNGHPATLDAEGHPQMIEGLANVWKLPQDGAWTDTSKWFGNAAVNPLLETYVDAMGTDYAVTLDNVTATITNLYVGSSDGDKVKLILTNDTHLTIEARTTSRSFLQLKEGASIDVASSELVLFNRGNDAGASGNSSALKLEDSSIVVSGTGALVDRGIKRSLRTDGGQNNQNGFIYFGTGTVEFRDSAHFIAEKEDNTTVQYHYYKPTVYGETARMAFHDHAYMDFSGGNAYQGLVMGNGGKVTVESDSDGNFKNIYYQLFIGLGTGTAEWLIEGNGTYSLGTGFMHIGTPNVSDYYTTAAACAVTGRLTVAGSAAVTVNAYSNSEKGFCGLTVGQGLALDKPRGTSVLHGELKVSDAATFSLSRSSFIVGGGPDGDGEVTLSGGKMLIVDNANNATYNPLGEMLVGGFGGNGRLRITDGVFSTRRMVYVGGTTTNAMHHYHANGARLLQYHDAQGSVRVLGGSFTTAKDIVLGSDGTGILELSGTGTVTAVTLVVSNTTGQAASMLKFTADATGRCGILAPSTALKFFPGAKLVVDVSANGAKRMSVLNLDAAPEGLTVDQIELIGDDAVKYPHRLEVSADFRRITYTVDKCLRFIIR